MAGDAPADPDAGPAASAPQGLGEDPVQGPPRLRLGLAVGANAQGDDLRQQPRQGVVWLIDQRFLGGGPRVDG
ncbi:hypothetical protein GCM10027579_13330 [Calidifontibacter terrae]